METLLARTTSQTTECLVGMKTLSSPPALKPEFSSWSLVFIGQSLTILAEFVKYRKL